MDRPALHRLVIFIVIAGTATATMTTYDRDYGETVSITLPPEVHEHPWVAGCLGS